MFDFYLAAPFFNPVQKELVISIRDAMVSRGYKVFMPLTDTPQFHPVQNMTQGQQILDSNVNGMRLSKILFAVQDFVLPENETLILERKQFAEKNDQKPRVQKIPMALPDAGVTFEQGFFFAQRRPIVLYSQNPHARINVMLACSAIGCLRGTDALEKFLGTNGRLNFDVIKQYDGKLI